MSDAARVFGALLGVAAAGSWLWVIGFNWSVVLRARLRPAERPPSMILLAGPVLVVVAVQALRIAAPSAVGELALPVVALGLALDPGALPLLVLGVARRLRVGRPPEGGDRGSNPEA
jgi:hypothetical protein